MVSFNFFITFMAFVKCQSIVCTEREKRISLSWGQIIMSICPMSMSQHAGRTVDREQCVPVRMAE